MAIVNQRSLSMEDQQPITDKFLYVSGRVLDVPNKNKKILDFKGNSEKWGCTRRNALYYIKKADIRLQKDLKKVDKRDITARLINLLELNIQKSMRQNNYGAAISGIRCMKDLILDNESQPKKFKHGRSTAYYG